MSILTHVTVGTNEMQKAGQFYDKVLGTLGIKRVMEIEGRGIMYGVDAPEFIVLHPINGQTATHANGGTIGFTAPTRAAVHAFHEQALANGGVCEGAPGRREFSPTAYGAYVRDPDGNKLCTFCYAPE